MVAEISGTGTCACPIRVWAVVQARKPIYWREVAAMCCGARPRGSAVLARSCLRTELVWNRRYPGGNKVVQKGF